MLESPQFLRKSGVSDHAAIGVKCAVRVPIPKGRQPIHPSIAADPVFRKKAELYFHCFRVESLLAVERLRLHEDILREVAKGTRRFIARLRRTPNWSNRLRMGPWHVAFRRGGFRAASSIMRNCAPARDIVRVVGSRILIDEFPNSLPCLMRLILFKLTWKSVSLLTPSRVCLHHQLS